ncbi:3'-5' exoribonuclease 1 [Trichoplax sp. H2]|nr:3'-5' exoribonuclease 1 [Trichoplax sp. H2]|eukprot:RDD37737.1 3'-5' exoribonuclease 1 [Trichoplax sp. H2]
MSERSARLRAKNGIKSTNQFDCYVIFYLEGSCLPQQPPTFIPEVIEYSAILINSRNCLKEEEFHAYCRPRIYPILSEYCQETTGVVQAVVDKASDFATVHHLFLNWLCNATSNRNNFSMVTSSCKGTIELFLTQCRREKVAIPLWIEHWIDLPIIFRKCYGYHRFPTISDMLHKFQIAYEGRFLHGFQRAENLAAILCGMLQDGCCIKCDTDHHVI